MHEAQSKTGGVLYFEPLHYELNDCFGALKNVQPDSVFSSREGMIIHPSNSDDNDDNADEISLLSESTASTSGSDAKKKASKKNTKSNCLQNLFHLQNIKHLYISATFK